MEGGVAATNGKFKKGDQIMSVNGADVLKGKQDEVVAALKGCSGNCKIKVKAVEAAECTSGKVLIISNYANEGVICDVAWRNPQARSAAVDVDCALVLRRHHL